jgi:hypothetical protein
MLDVERRPDIDAGIEQFGDILVALWMAAIGRIGVGEFIDDDDRRLAGKRRVEIELLDDPALIRNFPAPHDVESIEQFGRLAPAVGFGEADDDVLAFGLQSAGPAKHGKGLADAGRGAEENGQPATAFPAGDGEERIWIRPAIHICAAIDHACF